MAASLTHDIQTLGESITKELSKDDPLSSQCLELLTTLSSTLSCFLPNDSNDSNSSNSSSSSSCNNHNNDQQVDMTSILEQTIIGKTLTKAVKSFKRHKRTSTTAIQSEWETCIQKAETLINGLKQIVSREHADRKAKQEQESRNESTKPGLPKTVAAYRSRLVSQKKDMYKDPPVLPPPRVIVEERYVSLPTRREDGKKNHSGEFTFVCGEDTSIANLLKDFKPNCSPEEILRAGAFGGTYFRPIVSSVTNVRYKSIEVLENTVQPEWIQGLDKKRYLTNNTYSSSINKYKVKCGGSLGMWESSGWIADCDPYGWFQWYCRFYQGRRCSDDGRQIGRWLKSAGPKGRFRSQLCNKILAAGGMGHVNDERISPVIRQTLLHWGLEITEDILKQHGKRIGKS